MPQKLTPSEELRRWLHDFQPQVVYTTLGPIPHMEACAYVMREYGAKLVIHFMDDWYRQAYTSGIFRYQRNRMLRLFHELVEGAAAHLTICDRMSEEFAKRYGIEPVAFQNTIELKDFSASVKNFRQRTAHPSAQRLLYFGSVLAFAQLEALQFIARANAKLNQRDGTKHTVRIVTSRDCMATCQEAFSAVSHVEIVELDGTKEQFPRELANADVLLLPANFSKLSEEYLRFSMPTKIPGYLMSGVPVFVFAPASIAQVQYAEEAGWGLCVTESEADCINAIKKITSDEQLRGRLVKSALEAAQKNHDSQVVRTRFQSILKNI